MFREKLKTFIESPVFTNAIVVLILINAVTLGMETGDKFLAKYGSALHLIDEAILGIFVLEMILKFYVYRLSFFRSGWNVFDLSIISVSLLPATGPLAILRALRIFRVMRLFSIVPQMRLVITGLLRALPGMASVVGVIAIIFYICSVVVTKVFGRTGDPTLEALFGDLGKSMFTLFQLMTLEDWVGGIAEPAMALHPWSWMIFIPFIIITSFAILNLFIGVIVEAMQNVHHEEQRRMSPDDPEKEVTLDDLQKEIRALRDDITHIKPSRE
jgi:voltage-gated sodium channel